jgi:predicted transcriptional regulator
MTKDFSDLTYRPGKSGVTKLLGDLESQVMEEVWRRDSATVREVHQSLKTSERDLAYTTVMTVMSRLAEKGYLRRVPEGNAFRYWPTTSRQEFLALASLEVFSGLAEDLSGPVLSAFVDHLGKAESKRLQELGRLIEEKRKKKNTK